MKSPIIDCHAVLGTGQVWTDPLRLAEYKVEELLSRAAAARVDQICVMSARNSSGWWYEQKNQMVASTCRKYPDKLIGFAVHNPQHEAGHLKDLVTREVRELGMRGLKTDGHPTREILDVVSEFNLPVLYYPDPDVNSNLIEQYDMMATEYPNVNFIIPHLGAYRSDPWSPHIDAINLMKSHSNIHAEVSGMGSEKYLELAAQQVSAEQILFGSLAPELDPRVAIHSIELLKVEGEAKAKMLGGNIARLLGLAGSNQTAGG